MVSVARCFDQFKLSLLIIDDHYLLSALIACCGANSSVWKHITVGPFVALDTGFDNYCADCLFDRAFIDDPGNIAFDKCSDCLLDCTLMTRVM